MKLTLGTDYFLLNGKPSFLLSGEIHYFRINPKFWRLHLKKLKESGANTTSTYIPWDWHEYEEGKFDFEGRTDSARNLIKYIQLCKQIGLNLIVKPGPYILAEYQGHGLPKWFIEKSSKKSHAIDSNGDIISPELMSYLSEDFMQHVNSWYDRVMPIIYEYQSEKGGPIIMMQVCNEVGVFQWLSSKIDYNLSVKKLYNDFLSNKYYDIKSLNENYKTFFKKFEEIELPTGSIDTIEKYRQYFDLHLFYRNYYSMYIEKLITRIKSYNITVQLTHNVPGWIYGNAAELPMLLTFYSEIFKNQKDIIFGLDHIPEYLSFRNAHADLACNKFLKAMQSKAPIWSAELQAGSREHHVRCYAKEMETFYIASIAHGMKGFNYYMFSQGVNPIGKGYYGNKFYFQTPLDSQSKPSELYNSVKRVNKIITELGEDFLKSKAKAEICVGFYQPYFMTEFISSQIGKESKLDVNNLGLFLDPRFLREEVLFNGLLRSLQTLNIEYDLYDLQNRNYEQIASYKQLWVTSAEYMDVETQKFLIEYVKYGGNLIIYPVLPYKDLYLNDCNLLIKNIGVDVRFIESAKKINALDVNEIFTYFNRKQVYSGNKIKKIAATDENELCGFSKKLGKGKITTLGFSFGYTTEEHLLLIERLLKLNGVEIKNEFRSNDIHFVIRETERFKYVFLINYDNQKKSIFYKKKYIIYPFSYKVIKEKK